MLLNDTPLEITESQFSDIQKRFYEGDYSKEGTPTAITPSAVEGYVLVIVEYISGDAIEYIIIPD